MDVKLFNKKVDARIDMKLEILTENLNDQFQQILDAIEAQTELFLHKIQDVSDIIQQIEADITLTKLRVDSIKLDTKKLKLRSEHNKSHSDEIEKRLQRLEAAS